MNRNTAIITALWLLFFTIAPLSARERGVIKELNGKVEIRTSGGTWTAARDGDPVDKGTTISTGFNSRAVIVLVDSEVLVRPLTRMTLRELLQQEGNIKTELDLQVGRVRAAVKSASGVRHDFSVLTSTSTASVRGTIIEGDGEEWFSDSGDFVVSNRTGQRVTVGSGQSTLVTGNGPPSDPRSGLEGGSSVSTQTNPTSGGAAGILGGGGSSGTDYTVSDIVIELEFQE